MFFPDLEIFAIISNQENLGNQQSILLLQWNLQNALFCNSVEITKKSDLFPLKSTDKIYNKLIQQDHLTIRNKGSLISEGILTLVPLPTTGAKISPLSSKFEFPAPLQ